MESSPKADKEPAPAKPDVGRIDDSVARLEFPADLGSTPSKTVRDNNRLIDYAFDNAGIKYFLIFELPRKNPIGSNSQYTTTDKNIIFPLPTGSIPWKFEGPKYSGKPVFTFDLRFSVRTEISLGFVSWDGANLNFKGKMGSLGVEGVAHSENGETGFKVEMLGATVGETHTADRTEVSVGYEFLNGIVLTAAAADDGSVSIEGGMTEKFLDAETTATLKIEAKGALSDGAGYLGRDFLDNMCRLSGFESPML